MQFQTSCMPPFEYKQYSIWDDMSLILMIVLILILYIGCAYYLMKWLRFTIKALTKHFEKKNV